MKDPPAIQRIPWPEHAQSEDDDSVITRKKQNWVGYDTWVLNDDELPWLVEPDSKPLPLLLHLRLKDG